MDAKISTELQDTLRTHPKIRNVYFEVSTGLHHFNHVKVTEREGKADLLTVNGKEVTKMSSKQVLDAKAESDTMAEQTAKNSAAIARHVQSLIETVGLNQKAEDAKK